MKRYRNNGVVAARQRQRTVAAVDREDLRQAKLGAIRRGQVLPETTDGPEMHQALEEWRKGRR